MKIVNKKYSEIRGEIKTGDILLCSGTSTFSRLIQKTTKSPWSHVGCLLRFDAIDRVLVMESVETIGVRIVPISHYVRDYDNRGNPYPGKLLISRHKEMCDKDKTSLSNNALNKVTYPYDTEEIVKITARLLSPNLFSKDSSVGRIHPGKSFICSEYVYECFKSIGIEIEHGVHDFVTPSDFFNDPLIEHLAYLETNRSCF